jgi:hypothetical protein
MGLAVDLATGRRRLASLAKAIASGDELKRAVLPSALESARSNAAAHPTPQSRLAAGGLVARGDTLTVTHSLAGGSEYGSTIYRQFGPRRSTPAWFGKVAEESEPRGIVAAGDKALETVMDKEL